MIPLGFSNPTPFLCTPQVQRGRGVFRNPTRAGASLHLSVGGSESHVCNSHSLASAVVRCTVHRHCRCPASYISSFRRSMSLMRCTSSPSSMSNSVVIIDSRPSLETRYRFGVQQVRASRPISPGVTHPRLKRTFWPLLSSGRRFGPRHAPPPQALFCHRRPESALSPDCSPLTSSRGRFTPDSATKSQLGPLRHQTPFPVHPRHCTKRLSDWRPSVVPPCVRSFSTARSFTLSCNSLESLNREEPEQ